MGLDSTGSSPVFPNMALINPHSHFLNRLKLGSSGRRLYFDVRLTSKTKDLALLLKSLNLLRRFHRLEGDLYRVFPTYTRFRRHARSMKTYARVNGRIRLTLSSIRLLNINAPHTYYVLETHKGLMTHKDALRYKIGGLLLLIIH